MEVKAGYKWTEVGVIPEDWEVKLLGDIATFYSGGTPKTTNNSYYGGDISWITSGDLNKAIINQVNGRITQEGLDNSSAKLVQANTLLMALYGATSGVTAITKIAAAINQAVIAILPSGTSIPFLFYVLSFRKNWIIETYCQGGQPNLSGNIIKSISIPLPPLPEQHAIATALSDVDALLTALDTLIAKKRDIKQATIQQLLTGKTRLPGFSGNKTGKLGEFLDLNPSKISIKDDELVTVLRMEDVSETGQILNQHVMPFYQVKKGLPRFNQNDVLVAKITPCFENGKGACLDTLETKIGFGSTEFHSLRVNNNSVPRYIFYHTQTSSFRQSLEMEMIGTAGQKRVPFQKILDYSLPVYHSLPEQRAIATVLSDMDAEIVALEQRRHKTAALKQGMMQELLTGRTRFL